jgi:hypothetical protein
LDNPLSRPCFEQKTALFTSNSPDCSQRLSVEDIASHPSPAFAHALDIYFVPDVPIAFESGTHHDTVGDFQLMADVLQANAGFSQD